MANLEHSHESRSRGRKSAHSFPGEDQCRLTSAATVQGHKSRILNFVESFPSIRWSGATIFNLRVTGLAERLKRTSIRSSVARCRIPGRTPLQIELRSLDKRPVFQTCQRLSGISRIPRMRCGAGRLCRPGRRIRHDAAHWPRGPSRGPASSHPSNSAK